MSAGGSDNWVEKAPGRKIVHPQLQIGLSHISPFQCRMLPEHADPQLRLQRPRNKQPRRLRGTFQDGENVPLHGDGVKPKALAPGLYNARMTGSP